MSRRKRPASPQDRPSPNHIDYRDSSRHRREDGYVPPSAEDRVDAELDAQALDAARARGFAVATRCTRCGQWVVAPKSVALHMGPVCRAKSAAEVVDA
ncbi:MAG TPA: hypothetical protein PLK19_19175 [Mycobacterium sp.]|nr:hypothetical protein [Mycobacterium sp.]